MCAHMNIVQVTSMWLGKVLYKKTTTTCGCVQESGADALELNLSCPHGMGERGMGLACGQVDTPHPYSATIILKTKS